MARNATRHAERGVARNGKGIAPVVFAGIFIALTWAGIPLGGGTIW
ncbi:hypothetical protein ACFQ58_10500 [Agromyces sp. NPDC056523]